MDSTPDQSGASPNARSHLKPFVESQRFLEAAQKLNRVLIWAAIAGLLTGLIGGSFRLL